MSPGVPILSSCLVHCYYQPRGVPNVSPTCPHVTFTAVTTPGVSPLCPPDVPSVPSCPQVLFTGVVAAPALLVALGTLGGSVAADVTSCSHLVTDRVRRTVKFLCGVARGVPIVTPQWLLQVTGV